jgi:hypothetical protein
MPRWLIATIVLLAAALWWVAHRNSAPLAASATGSSANDACAVLMVPKTLDDAVQSQQAAAPFRAGEATLVPLAAFSVAGRVLGREDYHFGREADYSPTDLALGWGPMAADGIADRLQVSQGGRWYRYRWDSNGPPLAPAVIASHSANMHMVPADAAVAARLAQVRAGELLRLDGWLLRIEGDSGWRWQSSMSRQDVGAGACELVLVCSIEKR